MVRIATKKARSSKNPRFFKMDMRHIRLRDKYDAVTVLFGGFGYLLELDEVEKFLQGAKKHLGRGGLLVFEFWQNSATSPTAAGPSGQTSVDRVEDGDMFMIRLHLSKYDTQTNIHSATFDHYVLDIPRKKLLDMFSETHLVKTYSISHIKELLKRNGFKSLEFYNGDIGNTKNALTAASSSTFRVLAVARLDRP